MDDDLTQAQFRALRCFRDFLEERGSSPTLRELAQEMNYTAVGSAQDVVKCLQKKGFLSIPDKQASRSLRLTEKAANLLGVAKSLAAEIFEIPQLGRVPAGSPVLAVEDRVGMLSISKKILPKGKKPRDLFALAASGNSMTGAGILDGDWLIIESTSSAEVGDIVIARLDGDATVKRLGRKNGNWVLKPENPSYSVITDPFEVIGKVVALQRVL